MTGTLFVVATPIGNLGDITLRALNVLKEVDLIAAEDTRHTLRLLTHYGIRKPLVSYWGEKEKEKAEQVLRRLQAGQNVALVSDAGTPGISDPGGVLIRRAIADGVRVVPVPGPTALIAALTIAGFPADRFLFCGFLPPRQAARRRALSDVATEEATLVFYEAPHRVVEAIGDLAAVFGKRSAVVIRELTKIHEEVLRGTLDTLAELVAASTVAGEFVIVVEGRVAGAEQGTIEDALGEVRALMKKGLGRKEAVKRIADEYGISKKALYDRSLGGS